MYYLNTQTVYIYLVIYVNVYNFKRKETKHDKSNEYNIKRGTKQDKSKFDCASTPTTNMADLVTIINLHGKLSFHKHIYPHHARI